MDLDSRAKNANGTMVTTPMGQLVDRLETVGDPSAGQT
jgi:hypothetical protein